MVILVFRNIFFFHFFTRSFIRQSDDDSGPEMRICSILFILNPIWNGICILLKHSYDVNPLSFQYFRGNNIHLCLQWITQLPIYIKSLIWKYQSILKIMSVHSYKEWTVHYLMMDWYFRMSEYYLIHCNRRNTQFMIAKLKIINIHFNSCYTMQTSAIKHDNMIKLTKYSLNRSGTFLEFINSIIILFKYKGITGSLFKTKKKPESDL